MTDAVPPVIIFVVGALLVPFIPGRLKSAWLLLIPVIGFLNLMYLGEGTHFRIDFLDYHLVLGRVDKLSLLFAYVFHLISFIAILYALHVKDNLQLVTGLLYAGSALGAIFSGDLFSFFIFWEMLTVFSIFLI
jgi:multicomponent Na+:H+ antiporter subunit D